MDHPCQILLQSLRSLRFEVYSKIRDRQGKDNASLSKFLELVTPFIGVIAPADYLSTVGWKMIEGEKNKW